MYNVPVARKVCATCKWWRGKRELKWLFVHDCGWISAA